MKKLALGLLIFTLILCVGTVNAEEVTAKTIGEGATTFGVVVDNAEDEPILFEVRTDEINLLDALLKAGLIEGETVSWGFNVTTVNGIKADYEGKEEFWSIFIYDAQEGGILNLETAIGKTPVADGDVYVFSLNQ